VPRDELFICGSVLSNQVQGFDAAYKLSARGCQENLDAFSVGGIDYVDVGRAEFERTPFHPYATQQRPGFGSRVRQMIMLDYPGPDDESVKGQWKALMEMQKAGKAKTLAVSNFSPKQLDIVASVASSKDAMPTVNQLVRCSLRTSRATPAQPPSAHAKPSQLLASWV
jgi:diketogulonate reductase-like aldo/keto reductase